MSTTYMNLNLPVPSSTPGPTWAETLNTAVTAIDAHDHSAGKGTQIPTSGLNVNADLSMNSNALTEVKSVNLDSQDEELSALNVQALYSVAGDLWYNNAAGTPVQLTQGASVNNASSPLVPSGVIWPYGGSSAPTGFLLCDGSAVSRTAYADLFAAIGTVYGAGDGTTTFSVPDMRGRVPVGAGLYTDSVSGALTRAMGQTLGTEKHVLTSNEMPSHTHIQNAHTHGVTDPTHTHSGIYNPLTTGGIQGPQFDPGATSGSTTAAASTGISINSTTAVNQNTGGGSAHNIMQPSLVTNYIIKT